MDKLPSRPEASAGTRNASPSLLAVDEPPAFTVVNNQASASLVLACDHASHRVPRSLDNLGLDDALLRSHIGWDIGAAQVARHMSAQLNAVLILANYSRLVIDINRPLGHSQSIAQHSENTEIPGNFALDKREAQRRAEACFWPYHETLGGLVTSAEQHNSARLLVSVHSFTPVFDGVQRPWQIGILWDTDEDIANSLIEHLRQQSVCVGNNEPYDAHNAVGYTTRVHSDRNVLIEIRQDLIDTPAGALRWASVLADTVQTKLGPF
jgi:predicted N-formylglutamate amidohydrolase